MIIYLNDFLNRNCLVNTDHIMYVEEFSEVDSSDIVEPFIHIHFIDGQAKAFNCNLSDFLSKFIKEGDSYDS